VCALLQMTGSNSAYTGMATDIQGMCSAMTLPGLQYPEVMGGIQLSYNIMGLPSYM
jgi:hypothetical protein